MSGPKTLYPRPTPSRLATMWVERIPGGLSSGKDLEDYDPEQLRKGLKVEMEHTDDPMIALEIAMDHLEEDGKYYDKLKKIEKKASASRVANLYLKAHYGIDLLRE